ncbi:sulfotransferase 1C2-like [Actinia tenebrosa]|uniref:Sulfotransferase 1C2-like n=1 Tax=Actinia tenebrosa TaxID=6105 RepID=A0A6P8J4A4_ACTTE|nr:sulfotransferase 1C2-like [Actinia tenebrosa]
MSVIQTQDRAVPLKYKHPVLFSEIDGVIHMPGATKEILQTVSKLETKNTDVIIATWPKSGTTWAMEIVWQIFNDAQISNTRIDQKVKFIELLYMPSSSGDFHSPEDVKKAFENLSSPRLLKTHLPYSLVPKGDINNNNGAKIIWVVRNPKDCAVSYYHHYNGFAILDCDCTWDEFFEHFMNGKLVGGCWFQYTREWWQHRHDPKILVIKYEDLKKDAKKTIQKIASFVNKPVNEKLLQRIVEQTTFRAMQNRPAFDHSWFGKKPGFEFNFIRKGKVGDWAKYFTDEQNKRFEERFDKEMKGSGLTMDFFNYTE